MSFVTRSILDATSIYRCTAVLRWQLHTRSHFTILGQGRVSGDTVCRVHRAPRGEQGARNPDEIEKRRCDLSAPPGGPALSARVRSLLAACPSWRTRFSAPRMHLLAPRALGAKLHALTAYLRRSDGDAAPPPTNQFARQVAGPVRGRGRGRAPNTEETAYFRESARTKMCVFLV